MPANSLESGRSGYLGLRHEVPANYLALPGVLLLPTLWGGELSLFFQNLDTLEVSPIVFCIASKSLEGEDPQPGNRQSKGNLVGINPAQLVEPGP